MEVSKDKIYLLVKLLKKKIRHVDNVQQKHNLKMEMEGFNKLVKYGIDKYIDLLKEECKNGD